MKTIRHAGSAEAPHRVVALLHGSYGEPEDFARHGLVAAACEHRLARELVAAEMRAAWFADGSVVERIREAVIEPSRLRGYARVWLGGISLGALSALAYAARHEADVEGLVLLSPYPGSRDVLRALEAAGGPGAWSASAAESSDLEHAAWRWLGRRGRALPVSLWFGREDRFAAGQRLIGDTIDPAGVHARDGGHDWAAWRAYWNEFVAEASPVLQ